MNVKEIKDLLTAISKLDLKEVNIKNKDFVLKVRTGKDNTPQVVSSKANMVAAPMAIQATPAAAPIAAAATAPVSVTADAAAPNTEENHNYLEIKSPMVGTFYRSPSPDKPTYVQVGDSIKVNDVVCVIEAMKLFNEIECEVSGKIVKVLVDDSSPVEYDQVLFLVDPNA
ncbi:MAG: acetyl-CoA carboxylase biotin carboxyl carrier protein [Saprospiraceae bacterium]|jgi:acetyl-CoA carboxylase biotin carboxyl carrier protein